MTDNVEMRTLFISDHAYDVLLEMARMMGYVRGSTARGLCDFLEYLTTCNMQDARPDDVRAQDADMLADNIAPEWRMHGPRMRRRIKLSERCLTQAAAHCLRLGLAYPPARRIIHAPTFYDLTQCMSVLLEAIGTDWIEVTPP